MRELRAQGAAQTLIRLHDKRIEPCIACRACQSDQSVFGCRHRDDMQVIFDAVLACDVLVLATPIYSWYCTPPMKAALDRLIYGMNKYYGDEKGPSLWKGKRLALIVTCGYSPEKGADLWEEGIKRYCKHSQLRYAGLLVERHLGYKTVFMDEDKALRARLFARRLQGVEEPGSLPIT
jgi:multimeric flavodoxin WrbA